MPYDAAPGRYDEMIYRRCGRSGLQLPAMSLGLWHNFGGERPIESSRAVLRRAFDLGITHFDLANNYGPPLRLGRGELRPHHGRGPPALPRRAGHLHQGRLRHVARPVRRVGLAQVPAGQPRPEPVADGAGLRGHLLLAPLRPRHAARGDAGCPGHGGAPGQGPLRGHLLVLGREHRGGRAHPARPGHAAAHPPALVLDAEPLDRGGPAGRGRSRGPRLHRVLAAGAGHAHRPLPERHPRGLPRGPRQLAVARPPHRRQPRARADAERDRRPARPEPGPARARLDAARPRA